MLHINSLYHSLLRDLCVNTLGFSAKFFSQNDNQAADFVQKEHLLQMPDNIVN